MDDGSTPGSTKPTTTKLPKDKECPFCHQAFTSSSLGRHLDLYIKENPRGPDSVHDVEDIKRIRGLITRRKPRRAASTPSSSKATPLRDAKSPNPSNHTFEGGGEDSEPFKTFVNQANWQATGVINELPPMPRTAHGGWTARRTASSKGHVKEEVTRRKENIDVEDQGRAAELALKEVLESVKVANLRAHPPTPFDFNFFGLTLPQMYLHCLAPPPTLLAEPINRPHDLAWSIEPPSGRQCEVLRGWLDARLTDWRRRLSSAQYGNTCFHAGTSGNLGSEAEAEGVKLEESSYYGHLENAFLEWAKLSSADRRDQWHLECSKAYAQEKERHQRTQSKLDRADQELYQLYERLDQLALDRQAPDIAHYPATILPLSREAVSYLPKPSDLDHNALISKWRNRLQSARSTQYPLPGNGLNSSLHRARVNGYDPSPITRHRDSWTSHNGAPSASVMPEDEDAELADAPGEDDFEHMQQQRQKSQFEGSAGRAASHARQTLSIAKHSGEG